MDNDDYNKLYLLSYLITSMDGETVTGYSDLAARLEYLKHKINDDRKLEQQYINEIGDLVLVEDDESLDWSGLKELVERAVDDEFGSMFIAIHSKSVGPNKWIYEFHSIAPTEVLEQKIRNMVGPENKMRILQKVKSAAEVNEEELIEEVYT